MTQNTEAWTEIKDFGDGFVRAIFKVPNGTGQTGIFVRTLYTEPPYLQAR